MTEARAAASLASSELMQIHRCLQAEVLEISSCVDALRRAADGYGVWGDSLQRLLQRFNFFFVVYYSHSKAEDEIIMPALSRKGSLQPESEQELNDEHLGQKRQFEEIRTVLLHLKESNIDKLDVRRAAELRSLLDHLKTLIESITAVVNLHFRKEEEEVFPLLNVSFGETELVDLACNILGNRSSELVHKYLEMIVRDLPNTERETVIESIKQAAKGTRFENWLRHVESSEFKKSSDDIAHGRIVSPLSAPGASLSWHNPCSDAICCDPTEMQQTVFGCKHYRRGCKLLMPCCNELFSCRLCHDEIVTERSISNPSRWPWHQANRYDVHQIWCMFCYTLQPVSDKCENCQRSFAKFVCTVCRLYDDSSHRSIYHCPYCNLCRIGVGLGEDFYHCMKCNACVSNKLKNHVCREHILEDDCAICQSGLFDATKPLKMLKCGHCLHHECYNSFVLTNFRCPTCRKSIGDMTMIWRKYDEVWRQIYASAPPDAALTQVVLKCLDCSRESSLSLPMSHGAIQLPPKCYLCGSYNTERLTAI